MGLKPNSKLQRGDNRPIHPGHHQHPAIQITKPLSSSGSKLLADVPKSASKAAPKPEAHLSRSGQDRSPQVAQSRAVRHQQ
ncbi:hypothetical protein ACLOJK_027278 [Asimina triloba]